MSQAVCLYIQTPFLLRKMLVGNTQTRKLHPLDADCAITSLKKNTPASFIHTKDTGVSSKIILCFFHE